MRNVSKSMALVIAVVFLLVQLPMTALADSGDFIGEGSQSNPYRIYTAADLQRLATKVNEGSKFENKYFSMENDIDLSGISNWMPIGRSSSAYFAGHFNGNNHRITGLTVNRPGTTYIGLFGLTHSATIQDVHLVDCSIEGLMRTAGLAGYVYASTITGCTVTGTIYSYSYYTGGIVGQMQYGSKIINCYSEVKIDTSGILAGGIAGKADSGCIVSNSASHSEVDGGSEAVGGLVGELNNSKIENCFSSGNILGGNTYELSSVGGIAGFVVNSATVQNCYSISDVFARGINVGGIVGILEDSATENCVALQYDIKSDGKYQNVNRIAGDVRNGALSKNYALAGMKVIGKTVSGGSDSDANGQGITLSDLSGTDFWTNAENWKGGAWSSSVWTFENDHFPRLKKLVCSEEAGKWDIKMANVSVVMPKDYTYNGKEIMPSFTLSFCGEPLSAGRHYGISLAEGVGYSDGIRAGNVKIGLNGQGFFKGTTETNYTIKKRPVTIKADDKKIDSGNPLPEFTYTIEGAVEGDAVLAQPPVIYAAVADGSKPGTYTIIVDPDSIMYTSNYAAASPAASNGTLIIYSGDDATLSSLSFSEGLFKPALSKDTFSYTLKVPQSVSSLTVTPTPVHPNATIQVNGQVVESGKASQPISLTSDNETISIVVSTPKGGNAAYTINVVRVSGDAKLSGLEISGISLAPAFSSGTYVYSAGEVPKYIDILTVTPTADDPNADITVDGQDAESGSPITVQLKLGLNSIKIRVSMVGGTSYTYTVNVTRSVTATTPFGGNGESNDPYLIENADDLIEMAYLVSNGILPYAESGKYYKLTRDIDLSDFDDYDGGLGWKPIGTYSKPFQGIFLGEGHRITGLKAQRLLDKRTGQDDIGLFGCVKGGTIMNVHVLADFTGRVHVGGIAAFLNDNSYVYGSSFSGTLYGQHSIGGIAGYMSNSTVENCYVNTVDITGDTVPVVYSHVGGVAGYIENNSFVKKCYSNGTFTSDRHNLGGIVGTCMGSTIENCYSLGFAGHYPIEQLDYGGVNTGGIFGEARSATVRNCYSLVKIYNTFYLGGIGAYIDENTEMINCVALNHSIDYREDKCQDNGRLTSKISKGTVAGSYAYAGMKLNGQTLPSGETRAFYDGQDIGLEILRADFWTNASNWSEGSAWDEDVWNITDNALPTLKNMPSQPVDMQKWDFSEAEAYVTGTYIYSGLQVDPAVSVTHNGISLVRGRDYSVSFVSEAGYSNGTNAGRVKLELKGNGLYEGTKNIEFNIAPKPVTIQIDSKTISAGKPLPTFTYRVDGEIPGDPALAEAPIFKCSADTESPGDYPITVELDSIKYTANYTAAETPFIEGRLTVTEKASSDAALSGLTVSGVSLTPAFSSDRENYTVTVDNSIESLTVTPTARHEKATITVAGITVSSGYPSQVIALDVGPNTIEIVVTAEDGTTTKTYTITVTRQGSVTPGGGSGGGGGGSGGGGYAGDMEIPAGPVYTADIITESSKSKAPVNIDKDPGKADVDVSNYVTSGNVTVIMPAIPGVATYTIDIPTKNLTNSSEGVLTFKTETGSLIIPSNMLYGMDDLKGKTARISIGKSDKSDLPGNVRAAIGNRPLISLNLMLDGVPTGWSNPSAAVTVTIPYKPTEEEMANSESIVVCYIDGNGEAVCVPNGRYDAAAGTVTFTTSHFGYFAVNFKKVSFRDVPGGAWYAKAISFIAAREITSGMGGGNFSPDAKLTRGQFIVMLMRAFSIAPDTNPTDNFSDAGNTWYTGYLAAAKRLGISSGVGNNMFAPEKEITRQEMFTLLYNTLKVIGKLPTGKSGKSILYFSDTSDIAPWAREAMSLLAETGIISGDGGKLLPNEAVTRAQMAQILYNLLNR